MGLDSKTAGPVSGDPTARIARIRYPVTPNHNLYLHYNQISARRVRIVCERYLQAELFTSFMHGCFDKTGWVFIEGFSYGGMLLRGRIDTSLSGDGEQGAH